MAFLNETGLERLWAHLISRLNAKQDAISVLSVDKGGTGYNSITDTTYTIARYRASALVTTETDPTRNGVINWTYE